MMKVGVPGDCMIVGRDGDRFQLGIVARKNEEVLCWRLLGCRMRPDPEPVLVKGRLEYGTGRVVEVIGADNDEAVRMLFLPDTLVLSARGCVTAANLGAGDLLLPRRLQILLITHLHVKARCIALLGVGARFCDVDGVFAMLGTRQV